MATRASLRPRRRGDRRRRWRRYRAGRERGHGERLRVRERQGHLPHVEALRSGFPAEVPENGLREKRALLDVLEVRRDRVRGKRSSLQGDLIARDRQLGEPHEIGKGPGDLVHQADGAPLIRLEVVDQLDLGFETRLLELVTLHLVDDRPQPRDLFLRLRDLFVEMAAPRGQDEGHHADVENPERGTAEQDQVVEPRSGGDETRLLAGRGRAGLGQEVDPDQAASSPTCRTARPTATARLGAFSVSHSSDTDPPDTSICRNGFITSTSMPKRSFSCVSKLTIRADPPERSSWSIFAVEVVARKKSNVFCSSCARSSVTDRRIGRISCTEWSPVLSPFFKASAWSKERESCFWTASVN